MLFVDIVLCYLNMPWFKLAYKYYLKDSLIFLKDILRISLNYVKDKETVMQGQCVV